MATLRPPPNHYTAKLDRVASNFDHVIDRDIAEKLKTGPFLSTYSAWNFHGTVWWDCELSKYCCLISQYHDEIETIIADSIQDIMDDACDKYGTD